MVDSDDIADSTDWLKTPLSGLAAVENALHCHICKEFYDTPMITSCFHTFCSKCIRTSLSTDGCCPACRSQDQASKLRNNWQVQELVTTFLEARPAVLKVAREHEERGTQRPGKRKRVEGDVKESDGRTTRSKSRKVDSASQLSTEGSEYEPIEITPTSTPILADGLVECPLGCGLRMKIEAVEPHLDRCDDERKAREKADALAKATMKQNKPKERLSELNYSMLKENDLRRRMRDLGIANTGLKQLIVRRHIAWVNIWNANCDSSAPKDKRSLLQELAAWERTYGGNVPNHSDGIMKKDFDGAGWQSKNQDDFEKLIQEARESRRKAAAKAAEAEAEERMKVENGDAEDGPNEDGASTERSMANNAKQQHSGPSSLPVSEHRAAGLSSQIEPPILSMAGSVADGVSLPVDNPSHAKETLTLSQRTQYRPAVDNGVPQYPERLQSTKLPKFTS